MEKCQIDEKKCLKTTLELILNTQRKMSKQKCDFNNSLSCLEPLGKTFKNTIPFILYGDLEPFKVEGVTTCFDNESNKEKFVCFTTFLFRVINLEGDCAVLELLKFKNHDKCVPNCNDHKCSPCCQLHCENVDDLISTCVFMNVEISSFSGIQCLPAVCIKKSLNV
ncbi:CotY/CotZ family spore coat protein [Neobacillus novalis]|uniref:CotY/CotZ family spore coat protein n=1 Tax=Neobacillus novalis TaxID=220687 RepID=A0AA95SD13_9BACI|nr:CotY/CotZ family spore coat protein [Neobacillus novalis]WHY88542.1 CotY/CotZ family spore coat protein [Neobacillus novalis]